MIVMPAVAGVQGRDTKGEVLSPLPAVMVVIDARAVRLLGQVRGLHQNWKREKGSP